MPNRYATLEDAVRQGRAAVLPNWLSIGCTVWHWRDCYCGDEICGVDAVTPECPLNRGVWYWEDEAVRCSHQHQILEHETVFSVQADFTKNGIAWIINENRAVYENDLRAKYYSTREAAEQAHLTK